jgi:Ulp1 family protease
MESTSQPTPEFATADRKTWPRSIGPTRIIPINMSNFHWFMIILDMGNKHIIMADSIGGCKNGYLSTIFKWLQDECQKLGLSSHHLRRLDA